MFGQQDCERKAVHFGEELDDSQGENDEYVEALSDDDIDLDAQSSSSAEEAISRKSCFVSLDLTTVRGSSARNTEVNRPEERDAVVRTSTSSIFSDANTYQLGIALQAKEEEVVMLRATAEALRQQSSGDKESHTQELNELRAAAEKLRSQNRRLEQQVVELSPRALSPRDLHTPSSPRGSYTTPGCTITDARLSHITDNGWQQLANLATAQEVEAARAELAEADAARAESQEAVALFRLEQGRLVEQNHQLCEQAAALASTVASESSKAARAEEGMELLEHEHRSLGLQRAKTEGRLLELESIATAEATKASQAEVAVENLRAQQCLVAQQSKSLDERLHQLESVAVAEAKKAANAEVAAENLRNQQVSAAQHAKAVDERLHQLESAAAIESQKATRAEVAAENLRNQQSLALQQATALDERLHQFESVAAAESQKAVRAEVAAENLRNQQSLAVQQAKALDDRLHQFESIAAAESQKATRAEVAAENLRNQQSLAVQQAKAVDERLHQFESAAAADSQKAIRAEAAAESFRNRQIKAALQLQELDTHLHQLENATALEKEKAQRAEEMVQHLREEQVQSGLNRIQFEQRIYELEGVAAAESRRAVEAEAKRTREADVTREQLLAVQASFPSAVERECAQTPNKARPTTAEQDLLPAAPWPLDDLVASSMSPALLATPSRSSSTGIRVSTSPANTHELLETFQLLSPEHSGLHPNRCLQSLRMSSFPANGTSEALPKRGCSRERARIAPAKTSKKNPAALQLQSHTQARHTTSPGFSAVEGHLVTTTPRGNPARAKSNNGRGLPGSTYVGQDRRTGSSTRAVKGELVVRCCPWCGSATASRTVSSTEKNFTRCCRCGHNFDLSKARKLKLG